MNLHAMIKGSSVLVSKLYIQPHLANAKQMNSCFWEAGMILTPWLMSGGAGHLWGGRVEMGS